MTDQYERLYIEGGAGISPGALRRRLSTMVSLVAPSRIEPINDAQGAHTGWHQLLWLRGASAVAPDAMAQLKAAGYKVQVADPFAPSLPWQPRKASPTTGAEVPPAPASPNEVVPTAPSTGLSGWVRWTAGFGLAVLATGLLLLWSKGKGLSLTGFGARALQPFQAGLRSHDGGGVLDMAQEADGSWALADYSAPAGEYG